MLDCALSRTHAAGSELSIYDANVAWRILRVCNGSYVAHLRETNIIGDFTRLGRNYNAHIKHTRQVRNTAIAQTCKM
jgi:hypothetical protein